MPIHDPQAAVGELRLIKDDEERRRLRAAAQLSAEAHSTAMAAARAGMSELALAAAVEQRLKERGCQHMAFATVVAAGPRASVLHAQPTERALAPGELVLVDAAGEYRQYASDLSRTFPVGPRFSSAQAEIYALVLHAQQAAIDRIRPGESLTALHEAACDALRAGLAHLDVDATDDALFAELFPHPTSHWLGLDVHDAGLNVRDGRPRQLERHMALTVEPGLYFPVDDERVPARLRGIGVRIEDAVLVTDRGAEVLTGKAPKLLDDVEQLRAAALA
jgi:Xaa-Pro aminopeptidase